MNKENYKLLLNEIYNLKQVKRQGWLLPGRGLCFDIVESVSDHSWSTTILALLLLPDSPTEYKNKYPDCVDYEDYNKDTVIKMLIVHDLAEAYTGDIPKGKKVEQNDNEEKMRFLYYKQLKLTKMGNTEILYELWNEFFSHNTLNSRIAKDIDQLECYLQLFFYRETLISINGIKGWYNIYNDWLNKLNITTCFGYELKIMIDDLFYCDEVK